MNRLPKFRVWDTDNCYWADIRYILIEQCNLPRMDGYFSFEDIFAGDYKSTKLIFQQFTGLIDKNGRDIYEGDIVKCSFFGYGNFEVFWSETDVGFRLRQYKDFKFNFYDNMCEIIGNILENPELLK